MKIFREQCLLLHFCLPCPQSYTNSSLAAVTHYIQNRRFYEAQCSLTVNTKLLQSRKGKTEANHGQEHSRRRKDTAGAHYSSPLTIHCHTVRFLTPSVPWKTSLYHMFKIQSGRFVWLVKLQSHTGASCQRWEKKYLPHIGIHRLRQGPLFHLFGDFSLK